MLFTWTVVPFAMEFKDVITSHKNSDMIGRIHSPFRGISNLFLLHNQTGSFACFLLKNNFFVNGNAINCGLIVMADCN